MVEKKLLSVGVWGATGANGWAASTSGKQPQKVPFLISGVVTIMVTYLMEVSDDDDASLVATLLVMMGKRKDGNVGCGDEW